MSLIGKWVYLRGRGMEEVTFRRPLQSKDVGKRGDLTIFSLWRKLPCPGADLAVTSWNLSHGIWEDFQK